MDAGDLTDTVLGEQFLQEPHDVYRMLRTEGPVSRVIMPDGVRAWVITRYEEARTALADPRLAKDGPTMNAVVQRHATSSDATIMPAAIGTHLLTMDPPEHTRLRRLVGKAFTPNRIQQLRPRIEQITEQLLDEMAGHDEVNLIDALAYPLPMAVICEVLGLTTEEGDEFRRLAAAATTPPSQGGEEQAMTGVFGLVGFLSNLIQAKRDKPGDDLFTALVHARDEDDLLDETELVSMGFLLLLAGHETTVNLIGNGVIALLTHPDQLEALVTDPSLVPGAVEELLRFDGPLNTALPRFTTEEVTIGSVTIPEGEVVIVALLSANRDERRYEDPDRLNVMRSVEGQLAFGHGVHYCVGAPLARLEGEIAFRRLLERFPRLKLGAPAASLRWRPIGLFRGLAQLPIVLQPEGPRI